ncbi:MAG: hypothetical protein SFY67_11570 [Candidatus Melainabacteria bacterium]|nr:hypothetical protein [Candidatus Melainabacteria bacterium]
MTDYKESATFSEAIRCLESFDFEKAEVLFKRTIKELGPTHHQSLLSYKSLISIASQNNDYTNALYLSLDLLDAQTKAYGARHIECSKTANNIYTICNTLGDRDLAEEIMKTVRDFERDSMTEGVKKMRVKKGYDEMEQEEAQRELDSSPVKRAIKSAKAIGEPENAGFAGYIVLIVTIGLVFVLLGATFALGMSRGKTLKQSLASQSMFYTQADGLLSLKLTDTGAILASSGGSKGAGSEKTLSYDVFSSGIKNIAALLMTNPLEKEFWMFKGQEKLVGQSNTAFYSEKAPEQIILQTAHQTLKSANQVYNDERSYPDQSLGEDSKYENPFTRRTDYPFIQKVKVSLKETGYANKEAFMAHLEKGGTWPEEPALYPGCINCAHLSIETNASYLDSFVMHACDGSGRIFDGNGGKKLVLQAERGEVITSAALKNMALDKAQALRIWMDQAQYPDLLILLLQLRQSLLCALLSLPFFFIALVIPNPSAKSASTALGLLFLILSVGLMAYRFI